MVACMYFLKIKVLVTFSLVQGRTVKMTDKEQQPKIVVRKMGKKPMRK